MKQQNRLLIGLAAGMFITSSGFAASIVGSKHDLSTGGGAPNVAATETSVCVFCHTPHGADTGAPAPLWNKALPDAATFTDYTSSTLDGTADITGSVSLACLSCHDGSQAMDSVINVPGSGGYLASGAQTIDGTIGAMSIASPVPGIGTDLTNDHPVSVEYGGGGAVWGNSYALNDAAFADNAFKAVTYTAATDKTATTSNSLPLYEKTVGGAQLAMVECASCHDPHDNANGTFLRVSNAASAVCTSCHVK